jgi:hypothetical protein
MSFFRIAYGLAVLMRWSRLVDGRHDLAGFDEFLEQP